MQEMENFEGRFGCGRLFDLAGNQPPPYGRIGYERTANSDEGAPAEFAGEILLRPRSVTRSG
jgi:hypothetical protein